MYFYIKLTFLVESKGHFKFGFYSSYRQQEIGSLKSWWLEEDYQFDINSFFFPVENLQVRVDYTNKKMIKHFVSTGLCENGS